MRYILTSYKLIRYMFIATGNKPLMYKQPDVPVKSRRAVVEKSFAVPRVPHGQPKNGPNDNIKPTVSPRPKMQAQKPVQRAKVPAQKAKIPSQKISSQKETLSTPELKPLTQKSNPEPTTNNSPEKPKPQTKLKAPTQKVEPKNTKPVETIPTVSSDNKSIQMKEAVNDLKSVTKKISAGAQPEKSVKNDNKAQQKPDDVEGKKRQADKSKTVLSDKNIDPLVARALDIELENIMFEMWEALPDDPKEKEDKIVVNLLRNEAGDELLRVMGLNVTKRILNMHNNLIVKIHFTCRPQSGCLTAFLEKYKITKFKRINQTSNTFAAQMESWKDFDNICANRSITCGEAKVTVSPCYKFGHCPENLKTIYNDGYYGGESNSVRVETVKEVPKPKIISNVKDVTKITKKDENIETKATDKTLKPVTDAKALDKPLVTDVKNAKAIDKTIITDVKNTKVVDKPLVTDVKKDAKVIDKPLATDVKNVSNVNKEKTSITPKISNNQVGKEKSIKSILKKDDNIGKHLSDILVLDELEEDLEMEVPENLLEGDEELDDEDILALVSEGVVVDECSGSEE